MSFALLLLRIVPVRLGFVTLSPTFTENLSNESRTTSKSITILQNKSIKFSV